MRFPFIFLMLVFASVACMPETEQQKTENIIRDYLMENPEFVVEVINNATRHRKALEAKSHVALLAQEGLGSVIEGRGDITLVEFFDYQCGYCKKAHAPLHSALRRDKNIRMIYKEFPILGAMSHFAARAAIAAQKQNRYLEFHHALMTHPGRLDQAQIFKLAKAQGLDLARLRRDMNDPAIEEAIKKNRALAQKLSINGTPSFAIFNDHSFDLIKGMLDQEAMLSLFAATRAK